MIASALSFNAEQHEYRLDGLVLPSVTQVLAELSARIYRFVNSADMVRTAHFGTAVHAVIKLEHAGELDEDALDDQLRPYLAKWRQFRAQSGFEVHLGEQQVLSRKYGYAGTLDLFGKLNGRYALIDAKRTAGVPRTAGPQTAAYEQALRESYPFIGVDPVDRYALQLCDSKWQLVPFRDRDDLRVFLSALTLHQWSAAS